MAEDQDGDDLLTAAEYRLGTDPLAPDSNSDGIQDGAAVASRRHLTDQDGDGESDLTDLDVDGDGASNASEIASGTLPFDDDTDGDGVLDGVDDFPHDETRGELPPPNPSDVTAPVITLVEPTNATPLP
jgi:hypothetical protein